MITDTFHPNQAAALEALIHCYENGGKVLLCGNGGSAADCGHIAGELLKGFLKKRPVPAELVAAVPEAAKLQCGLPAIDLTAHAAAITAVANDLGGERGFKRIECCGRYPSPGGIFPGVKAPIGWLHGHIYSMYSFLNAVDKHLPTSPSFDDAAHIQQVMEDAYRSAGMIN